MTTISFHAPGTPAPQGSKIRTRFGMREASTRVKPWREIVRSCATIAATDADLNGPLTPPYEVTMWFYIERPRTTRATHPVAPTVGDLDKLTRACGDALTQAGVIADDRHIITLHAEKAWAVDEEPGVIIRVREVQS